MNELKIFENPEFGKVRTMIIDEKPYFAGADVANVLGYARPSKAILDHCRSVLKRDISTLSKNQYGAEFERSVEMSFIPESDVYRLVMRSNLPNAERFQDWVVEEVLPSIRKYGAYMTAETLEKVLFDPDLLIQLATNLKEERAKVAELEPKAAFYDIVADAKNAISIADAAKIIGKPGLGQNNLFKLLREKKILRHTNIPYQEYIDRGYFNIVEQTFSKPDGSVFVSPKTLVTQRGLDYISKMVTTELAVAQKG